MANEITQLPDKEETIFNNLKEAQKAEFDLKDMQIKMNEAKNNKILEKLFNAYNQRIVGIGDIRNKYISAVNKKSKTAEKNVFVKAFDENIAKFDELKTRVKKLLEKSTGEVSEAKIALDSISVTDKNPANKKTLVEARKKLALAQKKTNTIMPSMLKKLKKLSFDAKKIAAKNRVFKDKTLLNAVYGTKGGCLGVLNDVYQLFKASKNENYKDKGADFSAKNINMLLKKLTAKSVPKGYVRSLQLLEDAQNVSNEKTEGNAEKVVKSLEEGCAAYGATIDTAEKQVINAMKTLQKANSKAADTSLTLKQASEREIKKMNTEEADNGGEGAKSIKELKTDFKDAMKKLFASFRAGAKAFGQVVKTAIGVGSKDDKTRIQHLAEIMRLAVSADHLSPPTSLLSVAGLAVVSGLLFAVAVVVLVIAVVFLPIVGIPLFAAAIGLGAAYAIGGALFEVAALIEMNDRDLQVHANIDLHREENQLGKDNQEGQEQKQ